MDVAIIGVFIPILGILLGFFGVWTHHREKLAKIQTKTTAEDTAERAAQYATQTKDLEDRVRVLERIVTDKGYDVASQIEALRDQRRVEEPEGGVPLNLAKKESVR